MFSVLKQRNYIEKLVKKNPYSMFYYENSDFGFYLLSNYLFKNKAISKEQIKNLFPSDLKKFISERKRKIKYDLFWFVSPSNIDLDDEFVLYFVSDGISCPADRFKSDLFTNEFKENIRKIKLKYNINNKKMDKIVNWTRIAVRN